MAQFIATASGQFIDVKPSAIHGFGVFAAAFIPEDAFIGRYEGPIVYDEEDDGEYVLWVLEEDGSGYGIDGQNALRYVNHHTEANAIFYDDELYAIRDIEPGEEICHHYGDDWD
jgi:SET domain-containing protein